MPDLAGLAAAILLAVPAAADTAYVDGFGLCNGLMPCFITIQSTVDATAAPAEIFVFPGNYSESVDLAQMDGGNKGDISLRRTAATASRSTPTTRCSSTCCW